MSVAVTNPFSELLRGLTREQLHQFDDETLSRIANYCRQEEYDRIDALCAQELASFDLGPLYWVTTHTKTENVQYAEQGLPFLAPFPRKSYFVPLFAEVLRKHKQLFIPKSRTMMTSLSSMCFATWAAQWHKAETIVQTANEDKCAHLIDYVRTFYEHQPEWLKQRHPLKRKSIYSISWEGGGEVASIPSGADKIRAFHPTYYIQDESAFLPEGEECLGAVLPTGARIMCISSAGPGWFAVQCQR